MKTDIQQNHRTTLAALLEAAGLSNDPLADATRAGVSTNTVYFVTLRSGLSLVARFYGESGWPEEYGRARLQKEQFLHEQLASRGLAVPAILAGVETPQSQAVLMERLPGQSLEFTLNSVNQSEAERLWAAVGASLRQVHDVTLSAGPGEIVGDRVVAFTDGAESPHTLGWGSWAMGDLSADIERLSTKLPVLAVDRRLLAEVTEGARRHLDASPARLLHNDPSVGNVFVQQSSDGWRCSGWLDWEFARHGDPAWDCARFELFRQHDVPAPGPAFWDAYGPLDEINLTANRLLVAMFVADTRQYAPALEWLRRFPAHLTRLADLLESS
jgi:aminoglycoside phosphotransferase (APT) family kinase protein